MPKLVVTEVDIDKLQEDLENARTHSQKSIDVIKASLVEFGQVEPLVVHKGKVIGGNGRLKAMRELGWKKVSVHEFKGSRDRAIALALTLNRSAEFGEWDFEQLQVSLESLKSVDLSSLGFADELVELFPEEPPSESVDSPFGEFPNVSIEDGCVSFKFGDYSGRVQQVVYDSFVVEYRKQQQDSGEPMLTDVLRAWLNV